jgi:hypothetical protein
MTKNRKLTLAAITLLLASCAGTPFEWEDTAKVRNGMTEAEVTAILGKPYTRTQSGNIAILTWSYAGIGSAAKAVSYAFQGGRVTGVTTAGR